MTAADAELLAEFRVVARNVDLETIDIYSPALTATKDKNGVYFWIMRCADASFKVYAGRT